MDFSPTLGASLENTRVEILLQSRGHSSEIHYLEGLLRSAMWL